ncbi:homocysteine S-methyltransferase family protein [Marinobacter sp. chi1]|uniref:Homocysteine S-methyltransferase family protein n=1 Tax=Marinobacter suaedae TaxID=3057675 RepID=A0ABT8VXJ4_9GAMM|nr:homocysteine S-methyltransferase family protein [Marinobacter sp. chi1]MDO3720712.1 homocysteine S-methyltransferase family protein [Marinobacter sp. chi1]
MSIYREQLPQSRGTLFLTDGGIETTLIFHNGFDLPFFAAYPLLDSAPGRTALREYYESYLAIAVHGHQGFVLESPTWRANRDWGAELGHSESDLDRYNRLAIELLESLRKEFSVPESPIVISGCIGPRGDGYQVTSRMSGEEARQYHSHQIAAFADTNADMVSAITMTYPEEAIGITLAAQQAGIPAVISFTTETDGRLPDGTILKDAIERVDEATDNGPAYYMINCAHPDHFSQALEAGEDWVKRIQGIRANASRMSHDELDACEELDDGNPEELGLQYKQLRSAFPSFSILGGCCGTDHRHIGEISHHCH